MVLDNGDALRKAVQNSTYNNDKLTRTVPRIFISTKLVGGDDDLQAMEEKGTLDPKLQEAGFKQGPLVQL